MSEEDPYIDVKELLWTDLRTSTCERCHGAGMMPDHPQGFPALRPCDQCGGSGIVIDPIVFDMRSEHGPMLSEAMKGPSCSGKRYRLGPIDGYWLTVQIDKPYRPDDREIHWPVMVVKKEDVTENASAHALAAR